MRRSSFILPSTLSALAFAGFTLVSGDANAQTPNQPPPDGAVPATQTTTATTTTTAEGGRRRHHDEDSDDEDGRLRIGFNFSGGIGTGGSISGPAFGATFRVGWQFNRLMGLYGNLTGLVWAGSSDLVLGAGAGAPDLGVIATTQLTPIFALTPIDLLEIGAGPSVDYVTGGTVSSGVITSAGFSDVAVGLHGRLALHLGGRNPDTGRRKGFTIGADVHPTFVSGGPITFITFGLGADWY